MPFANFPDFESCRLQMVKDGKSEDSARKICGALQAKAEDKQNTETLTEEETKFVNEYIQKFQDDGRPPKSWFENCLAKNGDKADPAAYCGFLWSTVVQGQGADPEEVLKNSGEYTEMFNKTTQFIKQFAETQTLKDEEIFAVGKWNGDTYTHEDLKEIAENFNKLAGEVKPPLKIGHSENQKLLQEDGLPAGGWVKSLKVTGDKLLAEITDVPKKIYELIKNRAYRRKSAEIYPTYTDSIGKKYGKVLRAVAILGGDTPAVTTIGDILGRYSNKGNQEFKIYDMEGASNIEIKVFYGTPEGAAKGHLAQGHLGEARGKAIDALMDASTRMSNTSLVTREAIHAGIVEPKLKSLEKDGIFDKKEIERMRSWFENKKVTGKNLTEFDESGIKNILENMNTEQTKAILELISNIEKGIKKAEGGEKTVKTLSMSVSGEQFGEDFTTKFNNAMKTAFGEGITVKFEGENGGGDTETIGALKEKIAELEKQLEDHDMEEMKAKYDETVKVLNETKTKLADAEGKAAKLTDTETKLTEAQTKLQENEVKAHKAEVKAFIEKAKVEGKIIPANEPMVTALMEQIDGKAVIKFTEKDKDGKDVQVEKSPLELVKKFVESLPKLVEFKEMSGDNKDILTFKAEGGEVKIGNTVYKVDDLDLAAKAKKYSQEHNVTLEVAIVEVSK